MMLRERREDIRAFLNKEAMEIPGRTKWGCIATWNDDYKDPLVWVTNPTKEQVEVLTMVCAAFGKKYAIQGENWERVYRLPPLEGQLTFGLD